MSNTRPLQRRVGLVLAAAISASLLPLSAASAVEEDTDTLRWGIRASFNNYTGGATQVLDGATREGNGFVFELVEQSFDTETNRTEAQFDGTVIYRKYCEDNTQPMEGNCQLDMRFNDPKVVISDTESYLEATVFSKQYLSGETYAPERPVRIANLYTSAATFSDTDGTIKWDNIATSLTAEGNLMFSEFYNAGEGLDPLSFSYNGEGARPASDSGEPTLYSGSWDSPAAYDDGVHLLYDANPNVIVAVPRAGFALLDGDLNQLAFAEATLTQASLSAFDSTHNVIYFAEPGSSTLKAIDVTGSTLSAPREVHTAPAEIRAIGYSAVSDIVAAVASADNRTATLAVGKDGSFEDRELPSTEDLYADGFDTALDVERSSAWGRSFTGSDNAELVAMNDGTLSTTHMLMFTSKAKTSRAKAC